MEIELVPPQDADTQLPPAPPDPQATLGTPLAVHYGYSYCRSLANLQRDGQLKLSIWGVDETTLAIQLENRGSHPLRLFLFPGMIFQCHGSTALAPLVLADLNEVVLLPGEPQSFHFQAYSLDRHKPLPNRDHPVPYQMMDRRDPRFPLALRVLQAVLQDEQAQAGAPMSELYSRYRRVIVQLALWRATSGNLTKEKDWERLLEDLEPSSSAQVVQFVDREAARLVQEARLR